MVGNIFTYFLLIYVGQFFSDASPLSKTRKNIRVFDQQTKAHRVWHSMSLTNWNYARR